MLLPNGTQAFVSIDKLRDYCLNPNHPIGKHKAAIFKKYLDYGQMHAEILKNQILQAIEKEECIPRESDEFGLRFEVKVKISNLDRAAIVVTAWIIRWDENFPRLTTCYIDKK